MMKNPDTGMSCVPMVVVSKRWMDRDEAGIKEFHSKFNSGGAGLVDSIKGLKGVWCSKDKGSKSCELDPKAYWDI